jgi:hypothetical protein
VIDLRSDNAQIALGSSGTLVAGEWRLQSALSCDLGLDVVCSKSRLVPRGTRRCQPGKCLLCLAVSGHDALCICGGSRFDTGPRHLDGFARDRPSAGFPGLDDCSVSEPGNRIVALERDRVVAAARSWAPAFAGVTGFLWGAVSRPSHDGMAKAGDETRSLRAYTELISDLIALPHRSTTLNPVHLGGDRGAECLMW